MGRRPRFLIPFILTDEPVSGRTLNFPNKEKLQIIGGQFVAFGPHKDGGEYQWDNWEREFPRITAAQLTYILSQVPMLAGTSLSFGASHETASDDEVADAAPRNDAEQRAGRQATERFLGALTQELRGKWDGRGSTIFALVGTLKFAMQNGLCTREEIENAITAAGQDLNSGRGGRTLAEEIDRQENFPVLRGNAIMSAITSSRTLYQGAIDAAAAPSMELLTGYELRPDDAELPWVIYNRILAGEVHFVSGHSGAGKSTVGSAMSECYLKGVPWLDAEIERKDGHIVWVAAEDEYGTRRRMHYLLRDDARYSDLRKRFHLVPSMPDPLAFEAQCIAQCEAMAAMGKRVDMIFLDTWGASGLCLDDNDTAAVLRAMVSIKRVAEKTRAAVIVFDHLPLGKDDAYLKGNGAKGGNSGFVYRVTIDGKNVSIDCGKVRGAEKAKSYVGRIASKFYGKDSKGRDTTVNVFEREETKPQQREQSAALKLGAMIPGAHAGLGALQAGALVKFDTVAVETSEYLLRSDRANPPDFVVTVDGARTMFGEDLQSLLDKGLAFKMKPPYIGVRTPVGAGIQSITLAGFNITAPNQRFPWEQ